MWLNKINTLDIILASKSPRRQELLKQMGITFSVVTKEVDEIFPEDLEAEKVAAYLSELKMQEFSSEIENGKTVITSDTTVVVNNQVLNKPKDAQEALTMLQLLEGKTHAVCTGVTIQNKTFKQTHTSVAHVSFEKLSKEELTYYIQTYSPFDKAGAYGIQEWIGLIGIKSINGSFYTVMGLPTHVLRNAFIEITQNMH